MESTSERHRDIKRENDEKRKREKERQTYIGVVE